MDTTISEAKAGITKEYIKNFRLDESLLRKIYDVTQQWGNKLDYPTLTEFVVERKDNSFYRTKDIEEVLRDENTDGRAICRIHILMYRFLDHAETSQPNTRGINKLIRITFDSEAKATVSFEVSNEGRDWCFLVADEIDTQIKRSLSKSPVVSFDKLGPVFDMMVLFFILAVVLSVLLSLSGPDNPPLTVKEISDMTINERTQKILEFWIDRSKAYKSSRLMPFFLFGFVCIMALAQMRVFSKLLTWFFRPVFYWGDMTSAYDKREKTLSQVKWVIIIGLIISIVGGFVSSYLIK